ncbi:homoserine dehydrogenase [Mobilitalea sibirica]|uniref:Homoserine dehydrogenase n=1 Tax=Mobilitalea sibirica TaxID=1462919 RepID=A0A8J7HCU5_9FIRM|nr:homoserine dehydrogenase [Mobilitalea sibirica]MBH1942431.1 homoserine dehydrogenase [Mobilitalea sibirica]
MINIAVLGYGTIGSGVVEVLNTNGESIKKRAGDRINIKYVLDLREFPGDPVMEKLVHDVNIILEDPEVKIIVEVMGGVNPAYKFVKESLLRGKSVITSNKELVAKHGAELLDLAKEKNLNFLFEASVGGGIPIIRPLNQSLTADEIVEITGILNGTTNYILSKMSDDGMEFEAALKNAQNMGYAERNPEADIEGHDSCRKIAILSSLAFGMQVDFEDIYTEGITQISAADIKYAKALGARIKLFASSIRENDKSVYAMVAPMMIKVNHPLYSVNDVFNGIFVRGNVIGDVMFYGSGAGKLPTASAVVADVVDAAKHLGTNIWTIWSSKKLELTDINQVQHRFFVRVKDDSSMENKIKSLFGEVERVIVEGVQDEYAFITPTMTEQDMKEKKANLSGMISMIRVRF